MVDETCLNQRTLSPVQFLFFSLDEGSCSLGESGTHDVGSLELEVLEPADIHGQTCNGRCLGNRGLGDMIQEAPDRSFVLGNQRSLDLTDLGSPERIFPRASQVLHLYQRLHHWHSDPRRDLDLRTARTARVPNC